MVEIEIFGNNPTHASYKHLNYLQRHDIQHNDTQHNSKLNTTLSIMLGVIYAKCQLC